MSVVILVGSETGNSLDYGSRLCDDLERLGVESEVFLMDCFPLNRLLEDDLTTLLFVCSTTGDGEEPQNMKKFMKFLLRADLPGDLLTGIDFAVFGLGDSSYEKFNFVGKRVYRRMLQVGGRDFIGFRGEGDERNSKGIEGGWIKWWNVLKEKMGNKATRRIYTESEPLPPRHKLILADSKDLKVERVSAALKCELISCDRVTPFDHFQDTRLLKFKSEKFDFQPGDILNLKPSNDSSDVEELINLMGWDGDIVIYGIEGKNLMVNNESIDFPMNLKTFISDWIDFTRIPSRNIFKTFASLCSLSICEYSQLHYEKLLELSIDDAEYLEYVWRPKRNFLEILKDFQPTLKIEFERILQVFPLIKPRQFSIANYNDGIVELLIALIKEETPRGWREGLCSKWISSQNIKFINHVTSSHGSLNYSIMSSPKISKLFLFATGTGIAPIRSIIKNIKGKEIYLYFGFRSKEKDFYFESEWKELERDGQQNSFKIFSQGSRDKHNKKLYINEMMKSNAEPLTSLTSPEGICCVVAGNSRLNNLIQETLTEIWDINKGNIGKNWLEYLKGTNQYQAETWS